MSRALKRVERSIALATGMIERAGRHGRSVGPYVCATVELRVDDLRAVLALAKSAEELRRRIRKAEECLALINPKDRWEFGSYCERRFSEAEEALDLRKPVARGRRATSHGATR